MEIDNIIRLPHVISQKEYTKMGNLAPNTAGQRIRNGWVAATKIEGRWFIDIEKSPPNESYRGIKKTRRRGVAMPSGVRRSQLVHLRGFARKSRHKASYYYNAILTGHLFALVLGDEVFIHKDEAEKL